MCSAFGSPSLSIVVFLSFAMTLTREQFLDSPAAHAPPGVVPNLESPDNTRNYAFPLFIFVVTVTNAVFLAKLWVQLRIVKKMLLEDYILSVAWLVYNGAFCTIAVMICNLPVGMHRWDMDMSHLMKHLFLFNCAWIIYGILMILIKANILLQYIRIFVPDGTRCFTSVACYTLITLNTGYHTMFVFMLIFACVPRHKIWDSTASGRCLDWPIVLTIGNTVTFISDVIIWAVPQRIIWRLHLNRSKKWGLSALFTIGIFAIICSAVRIHYQILLLKSQADVTFIGSKLCFWGTCQVTAGFLVACLPTTPLLFRNMKKRTWAEKLRSCVRKIWKLSTYDSGSTRENRVKNSSSDEGGGSKRFGSGSGKRVVTDVEFDELVNRDMSIASQFTSRGDDAQSSFGGSARGI
ncbi:hypothetical protein BU24DRAFT_60777 [Aaosphaeria arxii CBS 175.79]|uniref:Rhodopsin domain-containing protein n=1 Tax=Aaosphaeria arxii CBS 175.79 TaxID=1450172 RepID=A0A6A5XCC4_9PLEO|nr:uncharacterized protein BU24DRAFT_60777 [Aaosphaeria arxii CBS 175.79]KAF2010559.1 hypothetical protein BU24DRAFT_60777 [Aaosphaeria arxii CBS 175.79]